MPCTLSMRFGDQALAERAQDRDAAADAGLEGDVDAAARRRVEDLRAVQREQRLVGGDDVLAALDRATGSAGAPAS